MPPIEIIVTFGFQVITAIGVLVGVYVSLRNHEKIQQVSVNIDGRLEMLLESTKAAASAQGQLQGRAEIVLEKAAATALLKSEVGE